MSNLTIKQIESKHKCIIAPQPKLIYIEGRVVKNAIYIAIKNDKKVK